MLLLISLLRLLIQEPCLLEVDQQTGSTILLGYLTHVLVHSSCQLLTVIRDGINSFDASPLPTFLPYKRWRFSFPYNMTFAQFYISIEFCTLENAGKASGQSWHWCIGAGGGGLVVSRVGE